MSDSHENQDANHDDHHGPWYLAHHWDNPSQQFEAGKLGMWLFLATEVLLFGGLFCAYAIWRGNHPELFKYGSQFLDTTMGAINTGVLILSSLTMAMAVTFAQQNRQRALKICLLLTLAGAGGFLVIKYFEYSHKFHEGWYPGLKFYDMPHDSHTWSNLEGIADPGLPVETTLVADPDATPGDAWIMPGTEPSTVLPPAVAPDGLIADLGHAGTHAAGHVHAEEADHLVHPLQDPNRPRNAHMFFNIYFMMTGLHGIHVIIGGILISWIFWRACKGRYSDEYFTEVDLGGLYWHIVDLIWIFLFPLFYLI